MNTVAADTSPSAAKSPALSVRQLTLSLPVGKQQQALIKGVDLDLVAGQVLGLVGESGCGKSLTANALLGMLPAKNAVMQCDKIVLAGEQSLSGLTETQWRRLRGRHLAMVFQEPQSALDPVFTVGQQCLRVQRRHLSISSSEATKRVSQIFAECGLSDPQRILASYPHQLSGGMQQRVMIAMALSCQPEVLIADEPTSALDISSRDQVLTLLQQAAIKRGTAVLLISHDLAAVGRICDRLQVMYAGRIVEAGDTRQMFENPCHPYTAALLRATPRLSEDSIHVVTPIPGQVQSLHIETGGCNYANRCDRASEVCSSKQPPLTTLPGSGQQVACHHPLLEKPA